MKTKLLFAFLFFNISFVFGQNTFTIKKLKTLDVKRETSETIKKENINYSMMPMGSSVSGVGGTEGNLSVSLTGGAVYNVPIKVPPGINGIQPEISLTYNSQGGNGLAGYGWNLSGISVITRIPATEFHDGFIDPVDFDGNDRFSFDGQRLLLKSGTYGADGAVYQTENFSNIKIESFGTYYNGPNYFKISYPDGSIAFYGKNFNSRSRTDYAITYWQNPQGIRISYEYIKEHISLSISKVKYGAKGSGSPINEIQFEYAPRKRFEKSYVGDVFFTRENILKKIKVLGNGSGYRNYELTHDYNSLGYERLTSITEKTGDNSLSHEPIIFNYNTTTSGINALEVTASLSLNYVEQRNSIATSFDLDGSGIMDFTIHPKTAYLRDKFWLFQDVQDSNGPTYFTFEVNTGGRFEQLFPVSIISHNNKKLPGQGIAILQHSGANQVLFKVLAHSLSSPLVYQYTKTWNAPTYSNEFTCDSSSPEMRIPQEYVSGDFNGDGLTDVLAIGKSYTKTTCYPVLSRPGEPCGFGALNTEEPEEAKTDTIIGPKQETQDVNIIYPPDDGNCCRCETRTRNISQVHFIDLKRDITTGFASMAGNMYPYLKSSDELLTGDVNGDGKTDIIHITTGEVNVYSLDGNDNLERLFSKTDTYLDTDFPVLLGDYNGDGKTDFMIPTADNSSTFALFLSSGATFYRSTETYPFTYRPTDFDGSSGTGTLYGYTLAPTDINGDGKTDIIDYRTVTYNNSSNGYQTIRTYYNSRTTIRFAKPDFTYGTYKYQSGDLEHFPIPIFLTSKKRSRNLEFAAISNNKVTAFEFLKDNRKDMLLRGVTKSGVTKNITYQPLSRDAYGPGYSNIYQEAYDETYPYDDINYAPGLKIVTQLERSGYGLSPIKKNFQYYGATAHHTGLGFLGFKGISSTNWHTDYNDRIYNVVKYDPHLRGAVTMDYSTATYVNFTSDPTGYISKTTNQYNSNPLLSNKAFKLKLTSSSTQNLLQGTVTNKSFDYDIYNNPKKITTISGYGQKTVELVYQNSPTGTEYFIGRPTSRITTTILDGESYTTEEQYTYANHLLTQKKNQGDGTGFITEDHTYDSFGNVTTKTTTPPGESSRSVSFEYDSSGRFMIKGTDVEGLETTYQYNANNGTLLKEINPFGLETNYQYDGWQRLTKTTNYLGNHINTTYTKNNNQITITTTADDGSSKVSVYDVLNRLIHVKEKDVLGQWVEKKYEYDALDRLIQESEPFIGGSPQWNEKEYDRYGRVIKLTSYTGKVSTISYNGLETTVNDGTKTMITTKDAWGNIVQKEDPGGIINYTYFANGNLKTANYDGVTITVEQDGWGRKIKLTDPSAGTYIYEYNGFGEITKETTPKGETNYTYDATGKLIQKVISGDHTGMTIQYNHDNTTKLLSSIDLVNQDGNSGDYVYTYDSYNRPISVVESTPYAQFTKSYTYNSLGQVLTEEYTAQSLATSKSSSKKIRNTYQNGGLLNIADFSTSKILWQIEELNARGQSLSSTVGNNMVKTNTYDNFGYLTEIKTLKETSGSTVELLKLEFDFDTQRGNLNSRSNSLFNWNETFTYDSMDRLTGFNDNDGSNTHSYDARGRIQTNSQIGLYGYSGSSYRQISLNLNPAGESYYNSLDHQNISYNAFSAPVEIIEHGKDKVSFQYNAFEGRANMFYGGLETDKTQRRYSKHYSADGSMEITIDHDDNSTKFVTFIGGDAYSAPAIFVKDDTPPSGEPEGAFYYLHRDYLGSILAITDENGIFKEKSHFDAWGNIVKLEDGNGNALNSFKILDRGYTGHEHLLGVGIIHMNGRLYDPVLHRFLSPDNYIQNPFNTQNFNRYGYVLNNPLKYSDPSGEFIFAALAAIAYGAIIGAAVAAAVYTVSSLIIGNWTWSGLGTSILYGAIGGAISGGLSFAATLASTGTSSLLQSTTMNMFSELASQVGTGAIMGDKITLGTVLGSIAGGIAGAKFGNWTGIKGGWLKNAAGEIGFNSLKGAVRGAVTGGVGAGIDGENIGKGAISGAKSGALGGFSQSAAMIATFGATYKPSGVQLRYANKMANAFGLSTSTVSWRKGGAYQALQPLWSQGYKREVTWGRNVVTFKGTSASTIGHEYGHIIQVHQQGWAQFQAKGIYEQLFWGINAYDFSLHPNSNEVGARRLARDVGGVPYW